MSKMFYVVIIICCVLLFCSGCNPIEEGIANAIETLILNTISDVWNTTVNNVVG